jgi:hypothetical protein
MTKNFLKHSRQEEEKILEEKVCNMNSQKREKFLEDYATFNYLSEEFGLSDFCRARYNRRNFSAN